MLGNSLEDAWREGQGADERPGGKALRRPPGPPHLHLLEVLIGGGRYWLPPVFQVLRVAQKLSLALR